MKKTKMAQFIGRQLSRLKAGQSYYMMFMATLTAVGVLKWALPKIDFWLLISLCFVALGGALILGYLMDKTNVITLDHRKTIEMTHRYLTTADFKNNAFRIIMTKAIFRWMKSIQEDKPLDSDEFEKDLKEFLKGWSPPE